MLTIPLDRIVTYKFKCYKLVEDYVGCDLCAFKDIRYNCPLDVVGQCDMRKRPDGLSVIFVEVPKPKTKEVREMRQKIANHCCEFCGKPVSGMNEHLHHVIDRDGTRHEKYECVETTRLLCHDCHEGPNKGTVLQYFRKAVDRWLLLQYNEDEVREITGRGLHI